MKRFKNILFVVSGTPANSLALQQALDLCRQNQAQLTLLIAAHEVPRNWEFASVVEHHHREQATHLLTELLATHPDHPPLSEIPIEFAVGEPFIVVIRKVLQGNHDLVIKAAEEPAPNHRIGFITMEMHLLRKCPAPIWLFKPHKNSDEELRLLAAIDPSRETSVNRDLTRMILELGTSLQDRLPGSKLEILNAWHYQHEETLRNRAFIHISDQQLAEYLEDAKARQQQAFHRALESFELRSEAVTTRFLKGHATEVIPDVVHKQKIDLLVMGTVARTGIAGLLIGNTAESILSQVDCSVLAVKPAGFETPVSIP